MAETINLAATRVFRVLALDNQEETLEAIENQLDPIGIEVLRAATAEEAIEILDRRYIDAAIIDLLLGDVEAGREVLRQMRRKAPAAAAVIATAYVDNLSEFIGVKEPDLRRIVHKDPRVMPENWAFEAIREPFEDWQARSVVIENIELLMQLLEKRRKRLPGMREGEELACELDRLLRRVFGASADPADASRVVVELRPIRREGISPAATVEANVSFARDPGETPLEGIPVVVKIASRESTLSEVGRYHRYVKYGVPLVHRVELLGHDTDRALGAAAYSFASRNRRRRLESLDEQFAVADREPLVREVLEDLFGDQARSWYDVSTRPVAPGLYFSRGNQVDLGECQNKLEEAVKHVRNKVGNEVELEEAKAKVDGVLRVGGTRLQLPRKSIWSDGIFIKETPTCLVHGDMQGGNVMLELDGERLGRVCLIDYANAGPGPRLVDLVALEASLRIGDAQAIIASFGARREKELDEDSYRRVAMAMAGRAKDEAAVLSAMWDGAPEDLEPVPDWARPAMQLSVLALANFREPTEREYIAVALPIAFRHFDFHISNLTKIRIAAWISAVYGRYEP